MFISLITLNVFFTAAVKLMFCYHDILGVPLKTPTSGVRMFSFFKIKCQFNSNDLLLTLYLILSKKCLHRGKLNLNVPWHFFICAECLKCQNLLSKYQYADESRLKRIWCHNNEIVKHKVCLLLQWRQYNFRNRWNTWETEKEILRNVISIMCGMECKLCGRDFYNSYFYLKICQNKQWLHTIYKSWINWSKLSNISNIFLIIFLIRNSNSLNKSRSNFDL